MSWLDSLLDRFRQSQAAQAQQQATPEVTQPDAAQGDQPGLFSKLGKLYTDVYLGPEAQRLTPEERTSLAIRGRLMALSAAAQGRNPTAAREGFQAAYQRRADSEQQMARYGDYLDQQIANTTDPAEKQRLTIAKLTGSVPAPARVLSSQARARTVSLPNGQRVDEIFSARDGTVLSRGEPYFPAKRAAAKKGDPTAMLGRKGDWLWFSSLPKTERARYTSSYATGPMAERARNAMKPFEGEAEADYYKRLNSLSGAAAPAAPSAPHGFGDKTMDDLFQEYLHRAE